MILFYIEAALLAGIAILGAVKPLKIRLVYKILISVFICLVAFKFHVLYLFGGPSPFAPDIPGWLLASGGWLFALLLFLDLLILLWSIVRWIPLLILKGMKKDAPEFLKKEHTLVLLGIAVILASVGLYCGTADPSVREVVIPISDLPLEAEGFTIVQITDLHADSLTDLERVRTVVDRVNALEPDLIALTGDIADGTVEQRKADLAPLSQLRAKYGVFCVPGNHEYYAGYDSWRRFMMQQGMILLENRSQIIPGRRIAVAGITDPAAKRRDMIEPDVKQALSGAEPDKNTVILLAHTPKKELLEQAAENGADLQLSGHTHGGTMFGLNWIISAMNHGYVRGLYQVGKMTLYIGPGTGIWNGFPIRLGVPAEITLFRLTRTE